MRASMITSRGERGGTMKFRKKPVVVHPCKPDVFVKTYEPAE
jgi:hypothetical protein